MNNFRIDEFKFRSGKVLQDLNIEFDCFGNKSVDENGIITNAVLYCHTAGGNGSQVKELKGIFSSGKIIDPDKYFVISLSSLGTPGSCAPSTSKLAANFPEYTINDMVNFQYLLLKDYFKINHLKGVVGASMGGFQTFQWAVSYPDFMDFIIPVATSVSCSARSYVVCKVMIDIIKSDPDYKAGNQPIKGLENAFKYFYTWIYGKEFFSNRFEKNEDAYSFIKDKVALKANYADANDVIWRFEAIANFDISDNLDKIKAKSLIIGIDEDEIFPPKELDNILKSINDHKYLNFSFVNGHKAIEEIVLKDLDLLM